MKKLHIAYLIAQPILMTLFNVTVPKIIALLAFVFPGTFSAIFSLVLLALATVNQFLNVIPGDFGKFIPFIVVG
jgi:hypothetical protein